MPRCNYCNKNRVTMKIRHQLAGVARRRIEVACRVCQRWAGRMGVRL